MLLPSNHFCLLYYIILPTTYFAYHIRSVKCMFPMFFKYILSFSFFTGKKNQDPSLTAWKQAPKKLFEGILSGDIKLQPIFCLTLLPNIWKFINPPIFGLLPFADQLQFPKNMTISTLNITSKTFRQACSTANAASSYLFELYSLTWKYFWTLYLTMVQ